MPFLKVDAQGFDFEVLRGAERLLRGGFVDRFLFEFMPSGMPDTGEAGRGLKFLQELGHYACTPCNGGNAPIKMSRPTCAASYVQDYATASSHRRAAGGDWYDDIACVHRRLLTPQAAGGVHTSSGRPAQTHGTKVKPKLHSPANLAGERSAQPVAVPASPRPPRAAQRPAAARAPRLPAG